MPCVVSELPVIVVSSVLCMLISGGFVGAVVEVEVAPVVSPFSSWT